MTTTWVSFYFDTKLVTVVTNPPWPAASITHAKQYDSVATMLQMAVNLSFAGYTQHSIDASDDQIHSVTYYRNSK